MSSTIELYLAKVVGILIFLIATVGGIYLLKSFYSSLGDNLPPRSRRGQISLVELQTSLATKPLVTPTTEADKIPARLPDVKMVPVLPLIVTPSPPSGAAAIPKLDLPLTTEESLLFRALVLAMVTISTIAVDLAAGTYYSLVVIPVSSIGAGWSWYRRHYMKHWLNGCVSLASITLVLMAIVPNLARQKQLGGGLMLGILAIGVQMALSFQLYNRQLLGYCVASSTVSLGVTASLSQNLAFLPLLCAFVAIAVPVLMLDYRSKLALPPIGIDRRDLPTAKSYRHLPWQYLTRLAAISLCAGLLISLCLPSLRLPNLATNRVGETSPVPDRFNPPPGAAPPSAMTPNPAAADPTAPAPTANAREVATQLFSQPQNRTYPPEIATTNRQLPDSISSQIQQLSQKILATSPQPLNSDFDRAAYLADYLKRNYQADPRGNPPPLDARTIARSIGQCQQTPQNCKIVASDRDLPVIYTSMLRSIGIPARLKTGERLAEIDPQTQIYSRPSGQAQSQTEVYFPTWGWFAMDAAIDRPTIPTDARQLAQLQQQLQQIQPSPTATVTPSSAPASASSPSPRSTSTPPTNPPSPNSPTAPTWNPDPAILRTIAIVLALCSAIAWWWWQHRHQQQQLAKLPPIERIYRSMLTSLSQTHRAKLATQTQLEYAQTIAATEHPQIAKVVTEISQQYTAWRYGKQPVAADRLLKKLQYLQHLQQLAQQQQRQRSKS